MRKKFLSLMKEKVRLNRALEIAPAVISWGIIIALVLLAFFRPVACAVLIIAFDFYWIIRTAYLTTLLLLAYHRLYRERDKDWLAECEGLKPARDWQKLYQLVIFPTFKEGAEILRPSLQALKDSRYPKEKIIVVVAFEERNPQARDTARVIEEEFRGVFFEYLTTFHPDAIPGETRTKGANSTWAAKKAKEFLDQKGLNYEDTVISCFDADTCVDKEYFGCLAYHFLSNPNPHQASYQPMPLYNNNIWYAPSFARLVEISASFCQMIESVRIEKFVTFSSHSMSFKTLVDIDYWPVNMISDDSVVYWKAFLFYRGEYRVVPLYINVSMDVAYANTFFKTIAVQYRQKRRWAWGVENFPYVVSRFIEISGIPLKMKIRRGFQLLESHVSWAVWAILITAIAPLPILFGGAFFSSIPIGYNLPRITGLLLNLTLITSLVWALLSRTILPPRPKDVKWSKNLVLIVEWAIVPFIILILGSLPALDAQTRLSLGRYMEFSYTEKKRTVVQ